MLTAHTLDDQAETVLMKLLRGAWTEGLSGIHPVVLVDKAKPAGKILRPLLGVRRAELEEFLREQASHGGPTPATATRHLPVTAFVTTCCPCCVNTTLRWTSRLRIWLSWPGTMRLVGRRSWVASCRSAFPGQAGPRRRAHGEYDAGRG